MRIENGRNAYFASEAFLAVTGTIPNMSVTGLLYSDRFIDHDTGPGHPERPARIRAIRDRLEASGLRERGEQYLEKARETVNDGTERAREAYSETSEGVKKAARAITKS